MNKGRLRISLLPGIILISTLFGTAADRALLVHNSRQEIEACKGKLKLQLVKVWGSDEEEDENKFFKSPISTAMDKQGMLYICDSYNHNIKIFDPSGKYIRTISRKGQGPGDSYCPMALALYPGGDLVVSESGGHRIQRFNSLGKSKKIIKIKGNVPWLGATSDNRLAVYNTENTFLSGKLLSIWDEDEKIINELGLCLEKAVNIVDMEPMFFSMDADDNIYALNGDVPVIRKYAPCGRLLMAITFDPPFDLPVTIGLNNRGDEIIKMDQRNAAGQSRVINNGNTITLARSGKNTERMGNGIGIDSQKRIYIITLKRIRTSDEIKKGPLIIGGIDHFWVEKNKYPLDRQQDHLRILVFNQAGKVIAEAPLTTQCTNIYINGNRMFLMDSYIGQCIREYEIHIED